MNARSFGGGSMLSPAQGAAPFDDPSLERARAKTASPEVSLGAERSNRKTDMAPRLGQHALRSGGQAKPQSAINARLDSRAQLRDEAEPLEVSTKGIAAQPAARHVGPFAVDVFRCWSPVSRQFPFPVSRLLSSSTKLKIRYSGEGCQLPVGALGLC